jgi:hypothetical protein
VVVVTSGICLCFMLYGVTHVHLFLQIVVYPPDFLCDAVFESLRSLKYVTCFFLYEDNLLNIVCSNCISREV